MFESDGISLSFPESVVPENDDSTLFVCSGMQDFKSRFSHPDGGRLGTVQPCVRTTDIDLVGDGSHLTSFDMVGNFSFGNNDYPDSVRLWHEILTRLAIPVTHVTCAPERGDHRQLWERLGYTVQLDPECIWSDGNIGGNCCEVFVGTLEIGNLVNTLGHSTDVGFGIERLVQIREERSRVDETSLFPQDRTSLVRDHVRTLERLHQSGVTPGYKHRGWVCRRMLRRLFREGEPLPEDLVIGEWLRTERELQESNLRRARSTWRRHRNKPPEWWYASFGIPLEEYPLIAEP